MNTDYKRTAGRISASTAAIALMLGFAGLSGGVNTQTNATQTIQSQTGNTAVAQQPAQPTRGPSGAFESMLRMAGLAGRRGSRGYQRARGPGWTNAHAKRVARKARSVKAHRARSKA